EARMAVEPTDEGPGAVDAFKLFAGDAEPAVARAADRDDDGVVSGLELVVAQLATDLDPAQEAHARARRRALEDALHCFRALMVGGDPAPHQAEGGRQAVDDVDTAALEPPLKRVRGVETPGTAPHDDDGGPQSALALARQQTAADFRHQGLVEVGKGEPEIGLLALAEHGAGETEEVLLVDQPLRHRRRGRA